MMKNLNRLTALTAVTIAFIGVIFISGHAAAQDVYVGDFSPTKSVYLITESISGHSKDNFKCSVRVVDRVSELIWRYEFFRVGGELNYTLIMNTGYRHTSKVFDGQRHSQPAVRIFRYVETNY